MMCCQLCKHIKKVKFLNGVLWETFHICDLFINEEDGYGIVVELEDRCECFEEKKE